MNTTTLVPWRDDRRMLDAIAANPGVLGGSLSDVLNIPRSTVNKRLNAMLKAGMVGRYAVNKYRLHYFTTQADADAAGPRLKAEYVATQQALRKATEIRYAQKRQQRIAELGPIGKRKSAPQLLRNIDAGRYAALDREILRRAEGSDGYLSGKPITAGGKVHSTATIASRISQLVNHDGLLHRARINAKRVHYFTSAQRAGEWLLSGGGSATAAPVTVKRAPFKPDTPVIIPPHVKVQRIPHAPGRFEVQVPKNRGQITADWMLARQGVDVRAVLALT